MTLKTFVEKPREYLLNHPEMKKYPSYSPAIVPVQIAVGFPRIVELGCADVEPLDEPPSADLPLLPTLRGESTI
jgi:hypothetical protein